MSDKVIIQALLEGMSDAVMIMDDRNRIQQVNRRFEALTGYVASDVLGRHPQFLAIEEERSRFYHEIGDGLRKRDSWRGEISARTHDAGILKLAVSLFAVKGDDGAISNYVGVFRKLGSVGGTEAASHESVNHDSLTGLPGLHLFNDRVKQGMINAKRDGKSLAIVLVGLDRFGLINDGLSHEVGDALLREVADRLTHCVRESDTTARLGGDQFGLALSIASTDDSVIVAEKVLNALAKSCVVNGQNIVIGASLGLSIFPSDAGSPEELLEQAQSAMRHAKRAGGNQYQFFATDMNARAKNRLETESSLRRALENDEFLVFYQPKVDAQSGVTVAMEALVRWKDPEKGMVNPGAFIPVAEESGLIVPLGYWVLEEACRQNKAWQDMGLPPVRVAVNVSGRQFQRPDLLDRVKEALNQTGLSPDCLELEITESMLMGNVDQTIQKLQGVRDLGLRLAIDDFGTGYSSLSYLSKFPITTLKIDRAFVHDIEINHDTAEIARAIIGLSQGLDLEVVAEGAETKEHVEFLREQGCDMIQGFYFSKPLPSEDFEEHLRAGGRFLGGER